MLQYDVIIIGAGPGGLAIGASLVDAGLKRNQLLMIDAGEVGQSWLDYPEDTHLLSASDPAKDDNMIGDVPTSEVFANIPHPNHVMYQKYLAHVAEKKKLPVLAQTKVQKISYDKGAKVFYIWTDTDQLLTSRFVVWAGGMFTNPNDDMECEGCYVHYAKMPYLTQIDENEVMIIGSANGASGVVMQLAKPGRVITLVVSKEYIVPEPIDCLWKENMQFVKYLSQQGLVKIVEHFRAKRIYKEEDHYVIENEEGKKLTAPDRPIICTGFSPNIEPIKDMINPIIVEHETFMDLDEHHQSKKQPGLYLGGVIGRVSHDDGFIIQFRKFAPVIAKHIISQIE